MATFTKEEIQAIIARENRTNHTIRPKVRSVIGGTTFYNDSTLFALHSDTERPSSLMLKTMAVDENTGETSNRKAGPNRYHAIHLDSREEIERLRDLLCTLTGTVAVPK